MSVWLVYCVNMTEKPSSIMLNADDRKIVEWLRRCLSKTHGKVSFTFVVRQAVRALQRELRGPRDGAV